MVSRRTRLLLMCGTAAIACLIALHFWALHLLDRAHPSHRLTLDLQDVSLRESLQRSFPGTEIVFDIDEATAPHLTLRVEQMSSVHVAQFLEKLTETVIYRRGERIVVTRPSLWYHCFLEIDALVARTTGVWLWSSYGDP